MGEAEAVIATIGAAVAAGVEINAALQIVSAQIATARAANVDLTPAQLAAGFVGNDAVFTAVQAALTQAAQTPSP